MKDSSEKQQKPRALGVIPARGGSKRLQRKNIMPLLGKPLLSYTIEAAKRATSLTDFLVTTEDDEIMEVAQAFGAPTPFKRPAELSGDKVRNIETVMHAMKIMEAREGKHYDILVLLQPTCPIRDHRHIDEAVNKLWQSDLDTAVSVKGPYKKRDQIIKRLENSLLRPYCDGFTLDDNIPFYLYNASIYAVKREYFIHENRLISEKQVPIFMDDLHSIDIDTMADFVIAEAALKHLSAEGKE